MYNARRSGLLLAMALATLSTPGMANHRAADEATDTDAAFEPVDQVDALALFENAVDKLDQADDLEAATGREILTDCIMQREEQREGVLTLGPCSLDEAMAYTAESADEPTVCTALSEYGIYEALGDSREQARGRALDTCRGFDGACFVDRCRAEVKLE